MYSTVHRSTGVLSTGGKQFFSTICVISLLLLCRCLINAFSILGEGPGDRIHDEERGLCVHQEAALSALPTSGAYPRGVRRPCRHRSTTF